jgi:hypothetical protein
VHLTFLLTEGTTWTDWLLNFAVVREREAKILSEFPNFPKTHSSTLSLNDTGHDPSEREQILDRLLICFVGSKLTKNGLVCPIVRACVDTCWYITYRLFCSYIHSIYLIIDSHRGAPRRVCSFIFFSLFISVHTCPTLCWAHCSGFCIEDWTIMFFMYIRAVENVNIENNKFIHSLRFSACLCCSKKPKSVWWC